jgi:hypothetical protein
MAQPLKLSCSFVRQGALGLISLALSLYLMWQFAESKWGQWPWSIFGGREPGFNRIELVLYLLLPLSIATLLAAFSGRAKVYLFAVAFFTLVLSLV